MTIFAFILGLVGGIALTLLLVPQQVFYMLYDEKDDNIEWEEGK